MILIRTLLAPRRKARRPLLAVIPIALFSFCNSSTLALSSSSSASVPPKQLEPSWSSTTGQRYLQVAGPTTSSVPPLLIIPGTAQSIELWQQHLLALSRSRSVVICEPLGVGLRVPENVDMSLPSQAQTLQQTLQSIPLIRNSINGPLDIAGFSLGGRIAMALACTTDKNIQIGRLHLTGVAMRRSNYGTLQIEVWKDLLENSRNDGDLRPFAWSALLASYSPEFLMGQRDKLALWVDALCQRHTVKGLRQLILQTHNEDEEWSVAAMAERLSLVNIKEGRLCVGADDQLAPVHHVQALAETLDWPAPTIIPQASHVPPIENPRAWRKDLETFLNET